MSLALIEQELDDIHVQLQRLRPPDTIERWSRRCGLSNAQRWSLAERDYVGDRCVAIEYCNRLTAADCPEVLAQPGLEFGNAHLFHDHIMTINGHYGKLAIFGLGLARKGLITSEGGEAGPIPRSGPPAKPTFRRRRPSAKPVFWPWMTRARLERRDPGWIPKPVNRRQLARDRVTTGSAMCEARPALR